MAELMRAPSPVSRAIVGGAYLLGTGIVVFGVVAIGLSVIGRTDFRLFGESFSAGNIGVGAIFIGGATLVFLVCRALNSADQRAVQPHAAGEVLPRGQYMQELRIVYRALWDQLESMTAQVRAETLAGREFAEERRKIRAFILTKEAYLSEDIRRLATTHLEALQRVHDILAKSRNSRAVAARHRAAALPSVAVTTAKQMRSALMNFEVVRTDLSGRVQNVLADEPADTD